MTMTTKTDTQAMDEIHALLDGTEWDTETIEHVAEIVGRTGRKIREPDYENGPEA